MQRLTGLDAAFLSMETSANHMHVMSVVVIDPSSAPNGFSFDQFRDHVESRLHLLPPFRRRLVHVPFDLHNPLWIEDPDFDIDYHLRRVALPGPGGERELAALVADVASRQLDRKRPLWEIWYVEGVEDGQVGLIGKVHHSAIDGLSGVELIANLFDFEADPAPRDDVLAGTEWSPDHQPNDLELMAFAAVSFARQPVMLAKAMRNLSRSMVRVVQRVREDALHVAAPLTAPKLTINGSISPQRRIAFSSITLDDIKMVKNAFGVKVNDVVLAVVGGALRTYLDARGELPDRPLVATIPTSVRTEEERAAMGNRVSAMFAALAVDLDDPVERLEMVHRSMNGAKVVHDGIGGTTLQEWAELASPAMFSRMARVYSDLRLADRHRPVHNLIVSNVPGPPFPLFFAGARVRSIHPMGPIFDGAGLNVTVISYLDSVDFGFLADRELMPDVEDLAAAVPDAMAELVKVAKA